MTTASSYPSTLRHSTSLNLSVANTMAPSIVKTMEEQKNNIVLPVSTQPTAWRVEIDEFLADTKMTNLFLLALDKMQQAGLGMRGAEELQRKQENVLSPLEDKDKVDWWTFYNLAGKSTLLWLYIHDLTSHRYPWLSQGGLAWRWTQTASRVQAKGLRTLLQAWLNCISNLASCLYLSIRGDF